MTSRSRLAAALAALLAAGPALADPIFLAVDVPTTLGGTTYGPHQIVRLDAGAYTLAAELPQDVRILALDRETDGRWLFVPAAPVALGASDFTPRDVVRTDGRTFARAFDGAAAGVPAYARINALLPEGAGSWIFSFDVPVSMGGEEFGRSDLVRYDGAFTRVWAAASAGVPAYANVVGVGSDGAGWVVSLDVPARIGAAEVLPGQIVRAGAESAAVFSADASWPRGSQLRDFAVAAPPRLAGAVPDGARIPGVPLTLSKGPGAALTLQWGAACGDGTVDYAVYSATLGNWAGAAPAACSTGSALTWTGAIPSGNVFYLVVPRSASAEGSYGRRRDGSERPSSPSACAPRESGACDAP